MNFYQYQRTVVLMLYAVTLQTLNPKALERRLKVTHQQPYQSTFVYNFLLVICCNCVLTSTIVHRFRVNRQLKADVTSKVLRQSTVLTFDRTLSWDMNHCLWLNGLVVSALGIRTRGPGFDSRVVPLFHWVATRDVHRNCIPDGNGNPMGIPWEWE